MKPRTATLPASRRATRITVSLFLTLSLMATLGAINRVWASGEHGGHAAEPEPKPTKLLPAPSAKEVGQQVREALESTPGINKKITLVVGGKDKPVAESPAHASPTMVASESVQAAPTVKSMASRQYIRAKAAALAGHEAPPAVGHTDGEVHWSYEGENGPQAWANLKPDFNLCATGTRQSPINIEDPATLQGPAEPIIFNYTPSNGVVVNNGHTIQVDLSGDNSITVRGTNYRLIQFHFHHPAEERVNYKGFSMVAHLVHKSAEGKLAVIAVLLEPGVVNPLINKVWTYMPLDTGDKVRMPTSLVELNELLPTDQRYYQFMGSLTTPPCSEGVLWMVLKQPMTVSREQLRLFSQLFPNNARPVQSANNRTIRNAQ